MAIDFFIRGKNYLGKSILKVLRIDPKTKIIVKNVLYSGLVKIAIIAISFLSVPLLISYLNSTQYGVWLTIITFTSWFIIFDLGLGNGLKNKLIEFIAIGDKISARKYVSTTYLSMTLISLVVCVFICFLDPLIPWNKVFNIRGTLNNDISTATTIVLIFTLLSMVLRLINNLLHAHQQSYKVDVINLISQSTGFISLVIVKELFKPSLLVVALVFSLSQIFILLIVNIYIYRTSYKALIPSFSSFDHKLIKQVTNLGGKFFFLQIAGLVMYMTDNFLIAALLGAKNVTVYNVALKYFTVLSTGWAMILVPLWPMTTKAYHSKDMAWIRNMMKRLIGLWLVTIIVGIIMFLFSAFFYKLWIGKVIDIPKSVSLYILLYISVSIFATIMATFINGTGKITLQVYITGFMAVINIPLAILFSRILNWGLIGVPFATTVCLAISSFFAFIQYKKIINNKAFGVWSG
jgi:O-antigen/teichoic acid export membrane protein